ncbi:MAG: hypothetical protein ACR2JF_02840 [Iamia sp.]
MRLVLGLLVGAVAGAAATKVLRGRGGATPPSAPGSLPSAGGGVAGPGRVAIDVSGAPAEPA